jgi:hypothetical protein
VVDLNEDFVMSLDEFRKLLHLSVSGERRLRSGEPDWPPHLMVGRKVFYLRDGVRDWLKRQVVRSEAEQPTCGCPDSECRSRQSCITASVGGAGHGESE